MTLFKPDFFLLPWEAEYSTFGTQILTFLVNKDLNGKSGLNKSKRWTFRPTLIPRPKRMAACRKLY